MLKDNYGLVWYLKEMNLKKLNFKKCSLTTMKFLLKDFKITFVKILSMF